MNIFLFYANYQATVEPNARLNALSKPVYTWSRLQRTPGYYEHFLLGPTRCKWDRVQDTILDRFLIITASNEVGARLYFDRRL